MRKILALAAVLGALLGASLAFAYTSPGRFSSYINDYTGTLSTETKANLEGLLTDFRKAGFGEIAVAVIPSLEGESIENYANNLGREWGVGEKSKDNGVLLVVAKEDREVRIEVGYGNEGALTDLKAHRIIDEVIIPQFKAGDFDAGINAGVREVVGVLAPGFNGGTHVVDYAQHDSSNRGGIMGGVLAVLVLVSVFLTRPWWLLGLMGFLAGLVAIFEMGFDFGIYVLVFLTLWGFLFSFARSKRSGGGGSSWGGGSSGGFSGGGGGSFGGGGSSGRW